MDIKLFILIIFSCVQLYSNKVEYYNWAMVEGRYDGKPIFTRTKAPALVCIFLFVYYLLCIYNSFHLSRIPKPNQK